MADHHRYKDRRWAVHPDAEALLWQMIGERLARCPEALGFAQALHEGAAVRLRDIVDHVTFDDDWTARNIVRAGWVERDGVWKHSGGYFPAFVRQSSTPIVWFRVESADEFALRHGLDSAIEGAQHGPARRVIAFTGDNSDVGAFERSGHSGFDVPAVEQEQIRAARIHAQAFHARRRQFDSAEQGLSHTEALIDRAVADVGAGWACDLWFRAERAFWMTRCRAGRRQKARQDALGIGWANVDHHTYDSARRHYRHTIRILEKLGFELREMLYAGELAGWGSQVLEQPVLKSTIFADVDLAPEELTIDFAHDDLPELPRHRRAGILSSLHGESILEAGLNHVAGLFDRRALQHQLGAEGIAMMAPFSDFEHLYQELTHGDWAAVDPRRVDALEAGGHIPTAEAEQIRLNGAIIAHLENIERNDGFKGFNRDGIDGVLRKLDPRAYDPVEVGAAGA
jgi:hypothetical protein